MQNIGNCKKKKRIWLKQIQIKSNYDNMQFLIKTSQA